MSDEPESVTRAERVDRLLAQAGWTRASRRLIDEFFLSGDTAVRGDDGPEPKDAFVDNALILPDGRPIAIVKVKRLLREALEGECQSADYADRCKRKYGLDPFIFQVDTDGRTGAVTDFLPIRLLRLRMEKLVILAGRSDPSAADEARESLQTMLRALPLEDVNVARLAAEIRALIDEPGRWIPMEQPQVEHLSHRIAPPCCAMPTPDLGLSCNSRT